MRAALALLLATPAMAQQAEDPLCSSMVQADLNACAAGEAAAADDDLNAVYQEAVARAQEDDQGTGATLSEELLRQAQRLWIGYRDAACKAETERFAGASMQPLMFHSCIANLTRERTERLRAYVDYP